MPGKGERVMVRRRSTTLWLRRMVCRAFRVDLYSLVVIKMQRHLAGRFLKNQA